MGALEWLLVLMMIVFSVRGSPPLKGGRASMIARLRRSRRVVDCWRSSSVKLIPTASSSRPSECVEPSTFDARNSSGLRVLLRLLVGRADPVGRVEQWIGRWTVRKVSVRRSSATHTPSVRTSSPWVGLQQSRAMGV